MGGLGSTTSLKRAGRRRDCEPCPKDYRKEVVIPTTQPHSTAQRFCTARQEAPHLRTTKGELLGSRIHHLRIQIRLDFPPRPHPIRRGRRFRSSQLLPPPSLQGSRPPSLTRATHVVQSVRHSFLELVAHFSTTDNAISFGAGMIPIVGDVFLAAFKGQSITPTPQQRKLKHCEIANSRNAALFEEFLVARVALERQAAATPGPAAHDRINNLAAGSALAVPVDTSEGALVGVDREVVVVSKPATKKKQWYGWGKGSNAL